MQSRTIHLITGPQNSGKTTALLAYLQKKNFPPTHLCGFISLANREKTCYRLKDLFSGEERVVLDEKKLPHGRKKGRFFVDDRVFAWANATINDHLYMARVVIFDEVGRFELEGEGFDPSFQQALQRTDVDIVAVVRLLFLQEIIDHYALDRKTLIIQRV